MSKLTVSALDTSLLTCKSFFSHPSHLDTRGHLSFHDPSTRHRAFHKPFPFNRSLINLNRNEKLLQDPVRYRQISERIPAGRWGDPKDFAGPIVFLASAASQYVCGEILVVDGVS